jgi:uncharacterized protein (DUF885 family)
MGDSKELHKRKTMDTNNRVEELYDRLSAEFFDLYYTYHPPHATRQGLHQYDRSLGRYHRDEIEETLRRMKAVQSQIASIDPRSMDHQHALDYPVLVTRMKREVYWIETWRFWQNNPLFYKDIITEGCFNLVSRSFAPKETRLNSLIAREREVPGLLQVARENLVNPPAVYTEQAIRFVNGARSFFTEIPKEFADIGDTSLLSDFHEANRQVLEHLERFSRYLNDDLLPRSKGDFAVGEQGIQAIIDAEEMIDVPVRDILARCYADLERVERETAELERQIDPGASHEEIFARLHANHPSKEELLPKMRAVLAELRQNLVERELMTLPDELPEVIVSPMPSYASAGAMMLTPGPFEQVAKESYLATNIPGADWSQERVEKQLRDFNIYAMGLLFMHEAYPGHHTQFFLEKRVPLFASRDHDSDSNSDGWAEYGKYMMVDEIYGEVDPLYCLEKLWSKRSMITAAIAGLEIHMGARTLDQTADFLIDRGKRSKESAWRILDRAIYYPSHLTYYIGGEMVLKLREDFRKLKGASFSLKDFHDRFMTYGLIPIKVIRQDMLGATDDGVLF